MRKKNKLIRKIVVIGILSVFSCVFISQNKNFSRYNDLIKQYEQQIDKQQELSKELTEKEEASRTDEYVERVARESLGMIKPGEKLYVDILNK